MFYITIFALPETSNLNLSTVVISFIVVIFSPITQFITHEFITPNYFDKLITLSVESKRLTLEEAQSYFNLSAYI